MSGKEKWTARGTGKCPKCTFTYSTFKKPERCTQCQFYLGGKFVPKEGTSSNRKRKLNNPEAVFVCSFADNLLYSSKVTDRDDRSFCLVAGSSRICYFNSCRNFRALAVASGQEQLKKFSCPHLEKVKDSVPPMEEHHLNSEKLAEYPGGADISRNMTDAADYAKQLGVPQVIRVSESSYVVCGIPDTSATTGFVHVKNHNDTLLCSVKHCRIFSGGKQLKTRHVCLHVHLLSCSLGLWKIHSPAIASSTKLTAAVSTCTSTETSSTIPTSSVARTSTLKVNQATHYPYHIPLSVISAARNADSRTLCGMDGGWPKEFTAVDVICRLCGSRLHPPRCHPGTQGKAFLITNSNPFLLVNVKVRMCQNVACQAMHQPQVYHLGLFNAGDKVLIAIEILLEWRELFKRNVPLSTIIDCKLKSLLLTVPQDRVPNPNTVDYLSDVMYNAFYCFELLTCRDMDDVVCGLCGTIGTVYFGDGNAKNCCSVSGVDYRPDDSKTLCSLEDVLQRITSHFVEVSTYTKADHKMSINISEIPPLIAPCQRSSEVMNTEVFKKSVYLTSKERSGEVEGDPVMLHLLLQEQKVQIDNINNLSVEILKEICNKCKISTSQRSIDFLRGRPLALYASITVGNSPCHKFTHVDGHSGGFYHVVCPHSCTVASKFLLLQESVRDAADLYLSLKYPPPLFVCDTPCGLARHIDQRCKDVAEHLWGDNVGCFQKPIPGQSPSKVSVPELATPEFKVNVPQVAHFSQWQHPTTGLKRRYIAGDRFHASVNPHKSELCSYHDINLLDQGNCIGTSYQESLNKLKNKRLQSSTVQSFFVHFIYNYLMDFYGNERVVLEQRKEIQSRLGPNQVVVRDKFHRFIIMEKPAL